MSRGQHQRWAVNGDAIFFQLKTKINLKKKIYKIINKFSCQKCSIFSFHLKIQQCLFASNELARSASASIGHFSDRDVNEIQGNQRRANLKQNQRPFSLNLSINLPIDQNFQMIMETVKKEADRRKSGNFIEKQV